MKTYLFILYVLTPSGEYSGFLIDYNLSRADCMEMHAQWAPTLDQYSTVFCEVEK